jgi:hypothetical protein
MQKTIDRSTNEIKCSIGVDVATQDACSTISNGKLSKTLRLLRKIILKHLFCEKCSKSK